MSSTQARMITRNARKGAPDDRHVTRDNTRTRRGKRKETREWRKDVTTRLLTGDWE